MKCKGKSQFVAVFNCAVRAHTLYMRGLTKDIMIMLLLLLCIRVAVIAQLEDHGDCEPILSASVEEQDEFRQLECEISTCKNPSKIIYEKAGIHHVHKWTPLFVGYNKTHYNALHTGDDNYTLHNRTDYTAFHSKHLLYLKPLLLNDHGEWRCILYDTFYTKYESKVLHVNIYVIPQHDKVTITPKHPVLLVDQSMKSICTIDGIHPEPDVVWKINDVICDEGTAINKQHEDGLWVVENAINLEFNKAGMYVLSCLLATKTRNPWMQNHITVEVVDNQCHSEPFVHEHWKTVGLTVFIVIFVNSLIVGVLYLRKNRNSNSHQL